MAEGMAPSWSRAWALGRGSGAFLPQAGLRRGRGTASTPGLQPDPCSCAKGQPGARAPFSWAARPCPGVPAGIPHLRGYTQPGGASTARRHRGVSTGSGALVPMDSKPLVSHPGPQHIPPLIPPQLCRHSRHAGSAPESFTKPSLEFLCFNLELMDRFAIQFQCSRGVQGQIQQCQEFLQPLMFPVLTLMTGGNVLNQAQFSP